MDIQREEVLVTGDEREMLYSFVDFHRATLALKCAGLTSEQAAIRSAPPSSLSLLGIVRHMTDVEELWFSVRMVGREPVSLYRTEENPNTQFDELEGVSLEDALERWAAACDRSRAIVDGIASLDELSVGTRRGTQHVSLRWLLMHMVEEYARHNGHADLLREAIDGTVGL